MIGTNPVGYHPCKTSKILKKSSPSLTMCQGGFIIKRKNTPLGCRELRKMQANSQQVLRLLKTARGQIDGIIKMVEEDRYCMDISQQLMASQSVLRRANKEVLSAHLKSCVKNARTEEEMEEKVEDRKSVV